jgi:hypothetical protein
VTFADPASRVHRRGRLPLLLAAAAVLLLGWLVAPSPVPLYDGVGLPDEPYRYVVPPPNYRPTPPPTEARADLRLDAGRSCCELEARSAEQGPQVAVYVPRGGLAAPGTGALSLVAATAAPPAGPAPVGKARFEGNLYRVTASSPDGAAQLTTEGARATIQLRALNGNSPGPGIWYRPAEEASWRLLPTGKVGFDIVESQFVGPGDYILVRKAGGSGSTLPVLLGILAIPAILIVALVLLRLRGGPPPDDEDPSEDQGEDRPGARAEDEQP